MNKKNTEDRIRELCARVVRAQGREFESALAELANVLESRDLKEDRKDSES